MTNLTRKKYIKRVVNKSSKVCFEIFNKVKLDNQDNLVGYLCLKLEERADQVAKTRKSKRFKLKQITL